MSWQGSDDDSEDDDVDGCSVVSVADAIRRRRGVGVHDVFSESVGHCRNWDGENRRQSRHGKVLRREKNRIGVLFVCVFASDKKKRSGCVWLSTFSLLHFCFVSLSLCLSVSLSSGSLC